MTNQTQAAGTDKQGKKWTVVDYVVLKGDIFYRRWQVMAKFSTKEDAVNAAALSRKRSRQAFSDMVQRPVYIVKARNVRREYLS